MLQHFRGVILSGGGARGAYSAGVLAAINAIDKEKKTSINNFYVGSSIGALNSTLAAQRDYRKLIELWKNLNTFKVLNEEKSEISGIKVWWRSSRRPFTYFLNKNIKKIIRENVEFDKLKDANLIITATNFNTGKPETFYISPLLPQFLEKDQEREAHSRRLNNYHQIDSQEKLEKVLLASAAIPFFLQPVKIGKNYYVDGGVGNNTPLQQAALFARYLNDSKKGICYSVICNLLDSGRFVLPDDYEMDMGNIIRRTIDIFQNVITSERLAGWKQINRSVKKIENFHRGLIEYINNSEEINDNEKKQLIEKINSYLFSTSATPRQDIELIRIRPATNVELENALDFDTEKSKALIWGGYSDALSVFESNSKITLEEKDKIENLDNYGV